MARDSQQEPAKITHTVIIVLLVISVFLIGDCLYHSLSLAGYVSTLASSLSARP